MSQLLRRLFDHAQANPDRLAYRAADGEGLSYGALARHVGALAGELRKTISSGAVVMIIGANGLDYPIAWLGALCAGCTVFAVSNDASEFEFQRAAEQSHAAMVIGSDRACAALAGRVTGQIDIQSIRNFSEAQVQINLTGALFLQSSGTTAQPKIVSRSARSLDACAEAMVKAIGFESSDRVLMTIPLSHSYGMEHGILSPIWAGASVQLCPLLPVGALLETLRSDSITILPAVPATFEMLLNSAAMERTTSSASVIRLAYSAGAPLPVELAIDFQRAFGVRVTQLYGASEIGSVAYNPPEDPFDPRSVGRAMDGVRIRILDADDLSKMVPTGKMGQVAISAASMLDRYVSENVEMIDGYFPTGDLGHLDSTGRLFVTGRAKLLIDVGGLKVNPLEVEAVICRHPDVGRCVVVAMRQSQTVNRLKAIVTPREMGVAVDISALRELARQNLAGYKIPRVFEVRESLPISPAGKILRHQIEVE